MKRTCILAALLTLLSLSIALGDDTLASPSDLPRVARSQPPRGTMQAADRLQRIFGDYPDRPFTSIALDRELPAGTNPEDLSRELFIPQDQAPEELPVIYYFAWVAPEVWYKSLYFDDVQLERYGQTRCPPLQPVLSGAHFFGTLAFMPYKMGLSGPFEMTTNYGYYRPGSPTPCVGRRVPWEWDAALLQAGFIVGGVFFIP